jgi:hypothetical protein
MNSVSFGSAGAAGTSSFDKIYTLALASLYACLFLVLEYWVPKYWNFIVQSVKLFVVYFENET